jgi:predicted permease
VETGLAADGVLFGRLYPAASTYPTGGKLTAMYAALVDRVRAVPGVETAALTSTAIVRDGWNAGYLTEDDLLAGRSNLSSARDALVTPGYFRALGVPVRRGRDFTEQDRADQPRVIIVNETMARLRWPGVDPVGRRIAWGDPTRGAPWWTVVGVVGDVKEAGLDVPTPPTMYIPYWQATPDSSTMPIRSMVLVVRARRDPARLIDPIRAALASVDPSTPIDGVQSVAQIFAESLKARRFNTFLLGVFGLAALGLAALGLYGVMSQAVAQRVPEIGLRMALGARPRSVISMVIRQAALFTGAGVLLGFALTVPLSTLVSRFLFGVGRLDPVTFAGVAVALTVAGLIAALVPARRAARIDPMAALRE